MRRLLSICLIFALWSCDGNLFKPESTGSGVIRIVIENKTGTEESPPDSLSSATKPTSAAALTELEIRILTSSNSLVTSKTLFPVEGWFEGTIEVKAQNNLKVLCIGKNNGVVERFAIDPDVDVRAGQTTASEIPETHWYTSYVPIINNITPNPSVDGSYNVSWSAVPNATTYVLEEADNVGLAGIGEVYTGAEPMRGFSGMGPATYYYRVRATNIYGIASGWSDIQSVVVSAPETVYTISGIVTGADSVMVDLSGDASGSLMVMNGGTYSFSVSGGGNYTIIPSRRGYQFEPSSSSYSNITSNQTLNFTGTPSATYTISGTVTGADGVLVTLSGDDTGTQVVNSGESYEFIVTHGGTYTVTPSRTNFKFTPTSMTFRDVTSNQVQDFTGEKPTVPVTLTININNSNWGTATPSVGTHTYASGDVVSITAEPAEGYQFVGWEGDVADSTSPTTTVTMSGDMVVTANYEPIPLIQYTFTILVNQAGWGITNPSSGSYMYDVDSVVTIVAEPADYCQFVGWEGDVADPTSPTTTVTMSGDMTVTANFELVKVPAMVPIPNGIFQMGSTSGENNERPVHTVNINVTDFQMSETEITQAQFLHIMGSNPSHFKGDMNRPVEQVSWFEAVRFCNLLSDIAGFQRCYDEATWVCDFTRDGFRLPTEAEWEYACRAGTTTNYCSGDTEYHLASIGWYAGNSNSMTHPVGYKPPNDFGLYDMHGNVWEWTNDWYGPYSNINSTNPTGPPAGPNRISRGGSWFGTPNNARSSYRSGDETYTDEMYPDTGFRIVHGTFKPGYIIFGTISGADRVTVSLSGDAPGTQIVNDGGTYTFPVNAGGNYTVTPEKAGYTFSPPSKTFINVTSNQAQNFLASVISFGGKIAFVSNMDGNDEIYVINVDGSDQIRLTNNSFTDRYPSWSPDGSQIVFMSYRDSNWDIYLMNSDGSNQQRLTTDSANDDGPSWSPDGSQIAFESDRNENYEIHVMSADGSNLTRVTNNSSLDGHTSWSPNGSQIVFMSNRDGNPEIYKMDSDGSNQTRLTNNSAVDYRPFWSPDGSQISFESNRDGDYEIYLMNTDGSNQHNITNNPGGDYFPSWSPDGSQIVFRTNRDGNYEIYVMNADGSNLTRVTNNSEDDRYPSWSPF
ncbi:SUMF1/EgtB/PvdO family nonheme iron enzyme [Candidatus Latescibacterota bacterium]